MITRLKNAGLLFSYNNDPEIDISVAWSTLSHLGFPARYTGKNLKGYHEYVILDLKSGNMITTGHGSTIELAMCEAALNAMAQLDTS